MRVAYLTNQYPKTSHSFIRREIAGIETAGIEVHRFSVRPLSEPLVDAQDISDAKRTESLLAAGALQLAGGFLHTLLARPVRTLGAARLALRLARRSHRGIFFQPVYLVEACRLQVLLRRVAASHLHIHFATNATTVALLCRALGGPPFSFTVHSTHSAETPETNALDAKLAACAFACAVSLPGLGQLFRWAPRNAWDRLHLIPSGVDDSFLRGRPAPLPSAPRLVCVARFSPEKGLLTLLDAVALLDDQWELVLVGDGPLRSTIESEIRRLGLTDRVRLTGWLPGEGVRAEIEAARALVIPSYVEGLPIVAMEALALGRPVVATTVGGLPELIEDGRSGQLVPCGSPEHLARGLAWVLSDAVAPDAVARGTQHVRELHDACREGARLAELFRALDESRLGSEEQGQ